MGVEQERAQGWRDGAQANLEAELSDLPAMMGVLDTAEEAVAFGVEGERVEFDESGVINGAMKEVIDRVVEKGAPAMVTRTGRIVAMIVPITLSELVRKNLENDPALRTQVATTFEKGLEAPVLANELFNKTGEVEA